MGKKLGPFKPQATKAAATFNSQNKAGSTASSKPTPRGNVAPGSKIGKLHDK